MPLITTLSRAIAILQGGGTLALMFYAGEPDQPTWYLAAIPFMAWAIAPAWLAWKLTGGFDPLPVKISLLAFQAFCFLFSFYTYYQSFFVHIDAQSAFVFLFLPFLNYVVIGIAAVVAAVISKRFR